MLRFPALSVLILVLALGVAACGGGSSAGGDAAASVPGAATVTNGEVPPGSSVFFGSAFDPSSFAVADRSARIKAGEPVVAVGRALAPVDGSTVQVRLETSGAAKPLRPPTAMDNPANATFMVADLTSDNLGPGTWIVSFVNSSNRVIASGFLSILP